MAFEANGQLIWAMHQDLKISLPSYVIKDVSIVVESLVKNQWKGNKTFPFFIFSRYLICCFPRFVIPQCVCGLIRVTKILIKELEFGFSTHHVMDVPGIVYPQYWLQLHCDAYFAKHLEVLKIVFLMHSQVPGWTHLKVQLCWVAESWDSEGAPNFQH